MKKYITISIIALFAAAIANAHCGSCGTGHDKASECSKAKCSSSKCDNKKSCSKESSKKSCSKKEAAPAPSCGGCK